MSSQKYNKPCIILNMFGNSALYAMLVCKKKVTFKSMITYM